MIKLKPLAEKIVKLTSMSVGTYLVWYFAGPLAGELGRQAFESYYSTVYGTPSATSLAYWLEYLPLRGHATNAAFMWGDTVCIALAAPLFYKLPDVILSYAGLHSSKENVPNEVSKSMSRPLLTQQMIDKFERISCQLDDSKDPDISLNPSEGAKPLISSCSKRNVINDDLKNTDEGKKRKRLK